MNQIVDGHGMGWLRDRPDQRDHTPDTGPVMLKFLREVPSQVDLRQWCSPIEDQGSLGSCTAFAGIGLVEYSMRRALGKHVDLSPLALYKMTRNMMGLTGDTGAYLRDMLKTLVMCGAAPEQVWPYDITRFEEEPSAFVYALGQSYQALKYVRLDPTTLDGEEVLQQIKLRLASGIPSCFGFTVYSSIRQVGADGIIQYPEAGEAVVGGHAVCAVGYDDNLLTRVGLGALRIPNSWGVRWGDKGYGWLPYEYVRNKQAVDFWAIIKQEWVDTEKFA